MSKPAGRCIFCGGDRMSKEHVWADWIGNILPPPKLPPGVQPTSLSQEGYSKKGRLLLEEQTLKQGDFGSKKIRKVCQACNSGWMSHLQGEAKPFLTPLLKGEDCEISPQAATIIASWVVMTMMVAEFLHHEKHAISQEDR